MKSSIFIKRNFPDWIIEKPITISFDPYTKIKTGCYQNRLINKSYRFHKENKKNVPVFNDLIKRSKILNKKYNELKTDKNFSAKIFLDLYQDLKGRIWANQFLS